MTSYPVTLRIDGIIFLEEINETGADRGVALSYGFLNLFFKSQGDVANLWQF